MALRAQRRDGRLACLRERDGAGAAAAASPAARRHRDIQPDAHADCVGGPAAAAATADALQHDARCVPRAGQNLALRRKLHQAAVTGRAAGAADRNGRNDAGGVGVAAHAAAAADALEDDGGAVVARGVDAAGVGHRYAAARAARAAMAAAHADDPVTGRRHAAAAARAVGDDGRGVIAKGADGSLVGDGDRLSGDGARAAIAALPERTVGAARPAFAAQYAGHDALGAHGANRAGRDLAGMGDVDGAGRAAWAAVVPVGPRTTAAVAAIAALCQRVDADGAVAGRGDHAPAGDADLPRVAARGGLRVGAVAGRRAAGEGTGDDAMHAIAVAGDGRTG
ncbi:hypothetical protein ACMZ4X_04854 [Achromobacter marplatensis]